MRQAVHHERKCPGNTKHLATSEITRIYPGFRAHAHTRCDDALCRVFFAMHIYQQYIKPLPRTNKDTLVSPPPLPRFSDRVTVSVSILPFFLPHSPLSLQV